MITAAFHCTAGLGFKQQSFPFLDVFFSACNSKSASGVNSSSSCQVKHRKRYLRRSQFLSINIIKFRIWFHHQRRLARFRAAVATLLPLRVGLQKINTHNFQKSKRKEAWNTKKEWEKQRRRKIREVGAIYFLEKSW